MRRQALFDILKEVKAQSKYIEIGYGTGIFAYEFHRMGFDVHGYESSKSAHDTAQELFNSDKQRLHLKNQLTEEDNGAYDVLGAYEVLEHIEDDAEALCGWRELLCENGILLLSVPAHMKSFSIRDERVGHCRRYEKEKLCKLLNESGFEVISLFSYGFPLPKLMDKATQILVDRPHLKRLRGGDRKSTRLNSSH